jgi:hypothetical protein
MHDPEKRRNAAKAARTKKGEQAVATTTVAVE